MNLHRLGLFSLSLFSLIARTGSISRGAELAALAVGAASKRITDLEAAVGTELLERHSRGVTLTIAGQALQRHVQRFSELRGRRRSLLAFAIGESSESNFAVPSSGEHFQNDHKRQEMRLSSNDGQGERGRCVDRLSVLITRRTKVPHSDDLI